MKLFLAKHAETEENLQGVLQGWRHGTLSCKGIEQAQLLARRFQDDSLDAIYSSDLARCYETAAAVQKYHPTVPLTLERLLRARKLGDFEGKKKDQVAWTRLQGDVLTNRPDNGETLGEIVANISRFFTMLKDRHKNDSVMVIGHGEGIYIFQALILCKDMTDYLKEEGQQNTGVSAFEISPEGGHKSLMFNCTSHLSTFLV